MRRFRPSSAFNICNGIPEDFNGPTMYDALINNIPIEETIISISEGLDLVPSNISTTRIEVQLNLKNKKEEKLKELLDPLEIPI
jgi:chromosome partitioning protein